MTRTTMFCLLGLGIALALGCREPLDFDRSLTADADRGEHLFKQNCANTCHPDNAFAQRNVKNYQQLAYKVRDYYEAAVGDDSDDTQQDVFDITKYLNRTYYRYPVRD